MRFCRGFLCFQNPEIWLKYALSPQKVLYLAARCTHFQRQIRNKKRGRAAVLVMDKYEVAPCKDGEKSAGPFRLVSFTWICAFILKIAIFFIFV